MMRVRFRRQAEADLRGIVEWFDQIAPDATPRILDDIYQSIDRLIDYPRSGMKVPGRTFRRTVTLRYHFKIAYEIDESAIVVFGIFRFQNRQA